MAGGGEPKLLCDAETHSLFIDGDVLWSVDYHGYVYKCAFDGDSLIKQGGYCYGQEGGTIVGGVIYFGEDGKDERGNPTGKVSCIDLNGDLSKYHETPLNDFSCAKEIRASGGWLYFKEANEYNALYRMKRDGSGCERIMNGKFTGAFDSPTPSDYRVKCMAGLKLSTEGTSACYKLFPVGTEEGEPARVVYLNPESEVTVYFDAGRYILKVATGTEWLGDELAFGQSGDYSTTSAYSFEAGKTYYISTGKRGDFYNDSAEGFTK